MSWKRYFFIFRIEITDSRETVLLSVFLVPVLLCQICKHKTERIIEVNVLMFKYESQHIEVKLLEWKHWSWSIEAILLKGKYGSEILKSKHWSKQKMYIYIEVKTYKWKHQHECINMQHEHIEFEILKLNYRSRSMEVKTCLD